jgi:hypothetical protein
MSGDEPNRSISSGALKLSDLAGLGEIGVALIEVFSKALGWVSEPLQTRRVGRAEIDVEEEKTVRLARAQAIAEYIRTGDDGLRLRAGQRLIQAETRRQTNIEGALGQAAALLIEEAKEINLSPESLDEDWMQNYLSFVENVSNERMRSIWARILARQVNPSRSKTSLATLDALRLVEPHHAEAFMDFARLWSAFGVVADIFFLDEEAGLEFTIYDRDLLALEGLNLVEFVTSRRNYFTGNGFMFLFIDEDDLPRPYPHGDYKWYEADYVSVRPSWRGLELLEVIAPDLLEPISDAKDMLKLGRWSRVEDRVKVLISWRQRFSDLRCKMLLCKYSRKTDLPQEEVMRSEAVPTHWFDPTYGWKRLIGATEMAALDPYPLEVQLMLSQDIVGG